MNFERCTANVLFTTNFTVIWGRLGGMFIGRVSLKIFSRSKIQITFVALDPFLFSVYQIRVRNQFEIGKKAFVTQRTFKRFVVRVLPFEV